MGRPFHSSILIRQPVYAAACFLTLALLFDVSSTITCRQHESSVAVHCHCHHVLRLYADIFLWYLFIHLKVFTQWLPKDSCVKVKTILLAILKIILTKAPTLSTLPWALLMTILLRIAPRMSRWREGCVTRHAEGALNIVMAGVSTLDAVVSGVAVPEAHTSDFICERQKMYSRFWRCIVKIQNV